MLLVNKASCHNLASRNVHNLVNFVSVNNQEIVLTNSGHFHHLVLFLVQNITIYSDGLSFDVIVDELCAIPCNDDVLLLD